MPQQVKTASASKWITAVPALGVASAAAAMAVGFAAPAAADEGTYLQALQPRYAYLTSSQLLSSGNQACETARSGVPASDNTIKVSKELGISTSAAYEIVVNAINHLGC